MDNSNQKLILRIKGIAENLPKIVEQAGSTLVMNVRAEARKAFNNNPKYPYEFRNSFQTPEVVYYDQGEQAVIVDHPAAKRLEYGLPSPLTIKPKPDNEKGLLFFENQEGELVAAKEVTISASEPLGYAEKAIKETKRDLAKKFKEIVNG